MKTLLRFLLSAQAKYSAVSVINLFAEYVDFHGTKERIVTKSFKVNSENGGLANMLINVHSAKQESRKQQVVST